MTNKETAKPIAWAFIIALIAGGIVVFLSVAGRMNQRIEEQKAQKAAGGNAAQENGAPAPAADATTQAPATENANPAPVEGALAPADAAATGNTPEAASTPSSEPAAVQPATPPSNEDAD